MERPIRVIIAKCGLDGHDRGARVIAKSLRDAGMEVLYSGIRQRPESIVPVVLQESMDVIGLSIHSGAHLLICSRLKELLREAKLDDVLLVIGGIIPKEDVPQLHALGVQGVFSPGTPIREIVDFIRSNVKRHL